jgi:hypothetical protein
MLAIMMESGLAHLNLLHDRTHMRVFILHVLGSSKKNVLNENVEYVAGIMKSIAYLPKVRFYV